MYIDASVSRDSLTCVRNLESLLGEDESCTASVVL